MPYVQSRVSRLYCLSPDAQESLASNKLSSGGCGELSLVQIYREMVSFSSRMTLPFIVQGKLPLQGN
jgi:hypothetical protein